MPSGPQSHQIMEVAVADVLAERVHNAPRVVMGAFDVHGHPVPAELQVAHAVPLTKMPRGLREVRMRLEPEPARVLDRAEHDPLSENQRHLNGCSRITAEGISAEVIDLATLKPYDEDTLLGSVAKTGRCVIVHEAAPTGGFGAEIAALIAERGLTSLLAPVARVTGYDTVMPLPRLEQHYMPSVDRIAAAGRKACQFS